MTLTNQPQGGRGCGSRKAGCAYGSMGTGSDGLPIWDFVLDPPIRWLGDHKFRGVRPSPDWLITAILEYAEINEILADVLQYESGKEDHWIENNIVLVDMIGIGKSLGTGYPTAPSFVEEVRRFGMSRRLDGIDWSSLAGRKPWLVPIHWRALATLREGYAEVDYRNCHGSLTSEYEGKTYHYPDCLYHLWPLSTHFHETSGGKWHGDNEENQWYELTRCKMPWGAFTPALGIVGQIKTDEGWSPRELSNAGVGAWEPIVLSIADHLSTNGPAAFAIFPVTHIETIGPPLDQGVVESGLEVIEVKE